MAKTIPKMIIKSSSKKIGDYKMQFEFENFKNYGKDEETSAEMEIP
jgi:hypothetical protein